MPSAPRAASTATFLRSHAQGFGEIEAELDACTPAWGEAVTGVPARLIEEAALLYADGPSLLWMGQGFQRQSFGGNAMRAVALLPAATGNLGKYGAGFLYLNGWDTRGIDGDYLTASHLRPASAETISHMDLARRLESPETKAIITWNNNIAVSSPEQRRLRRALERESLLQVTLDLFQTETADYADYVLPAASFLEFDDVVMSYFNASISAQVKALPPLGESLPNQDIVRRLAKAMGLTDPELFETDRELIATLLDQAKPGLTFDALAQVGTIECPAEPIVQFERHDYRTPSGNIELAGDSFVAAGLPRAPFASAEARPEAGELRLLSPASKWLMNSSFGNDPKILKQLGEDEAMMHPDEARSRGIAGGALVRIGNPTGAITLKLALSADVPRGVILAYKSRWTANGTDSQRQCAQSGTKGRSRRELRRSQHQRLGRARLRSRGRPLVQPELALDEAELLRRDQAPVRHADAIERTFEIGGPKAEEIGEPWEARREIVVLPDIALKQAPMVRELIENLRRGERIALKLAEQGSISHWQPCWSCFLCAFRLASQASRVQSDLSAKSAS